MTPEAFLELAMRISLALVGAAFFVAFMRLVLGPTLADRVLALDMLVTVGIGFIAIMTVKTEYGQYLDVAIALGLVGFLATVAFSRYILARGRRPDRRERERIAAESGPSASVAKEPK